MAKARFDQLAGEKYFLSRLLEPGGWVPEEVAYIALQPYKGNKSKIRRAAKEIGVQSRNFDGIQYWRLP